MTEVMRFVLAVFATYRLARIVAVDEIGHGWRAWLGKRAAGKPRYSPSWILAGVTGCAECAGVWIAFPIALVMQPANAGEFFLYWLAVAGFQVWLESKT